MAPIRRYLRITKHSVLECRIFLENPADGPRWLLNANDPALPRVIEAVKPYVLPKLREENERLKDKGKKRKTVKDVVRKDDFDVSIFLTEIGTRHALMIKQKTAVDRESANNNNNNRNKNNNENSHHRGYHADGHAVTIRGESDDDSDDDMRINDILDASDDDEPDRLGDKKKLAFNTRYDGFNIWGFVLCLLVERKGSVVQPTSQGHAQALMEEWISTQQEQREDGM